jgi:hypothetical protein
VWGYILRLVASALFCKAKCPLYHIICVGNIKLTIKFVDTKTSKKKGPYTLALPLYSTTAQLLLCTRSAAINANRVCLWEATEEQVHAALKAILGQRTDLRALRRTGLSRLAASGCPLETLMTISRHASVAMLERYLSSGLFHGQAHEDQMNALMKAWDFEIPATYVDRQKF